MKRGDIGSVDEILGWDCRGDDEEYECMDKARQAFDRIKLELRELRKQNKMLREAAKLFIADVGEHGESFCTDVGHNPETCNECKLRELAK